MRYIYSEFIYPCIELLQQVDQTTCEYNSTSVLTADLGVLDTFIYLFSLALLLCVPFWLH